MDTMLPRKLDVRTTINSLQLTEILTIVRLLRRQNIKPFTSGSFVSYIMYEENPLCAKTMYVMKACRSNDLRVTFRNCVHIIGIEKLMIS